MPSPAQSSPALPAQVRPPSADAALRAQLADLKVQRAGLRAEWQGLRSQLNDMSMTNPARPPVQQKTADLGMQLANIDGNIARIQAQLGGETYTEQGTSQPPPLDRNKGPIILAGIAMLTALAFPLVLARARRIWKGATPPVAPRDPEVIARLDRLEAAVDTIAIEIERVSEGQRFVTKILAERPAQTTSRQQDADEKPVLALGAGPAEPIVVASPEERIGVRR